MNELGDMRCAHPPVITTGAGGTNARAAIFTTKGMVLCKVVGLCVQRACVHLKLMHRHNHTR